MDISSSITGIPSSTQAEVTKKSTEAEEQQSLKVIESANEQSREVTAQKTGVGKNLNITG